MLISNIEKPFAWSGANPDRKKEEQDRENCSHEHGADAPYAVVVPYSTLHSSTAEPSGLTVAFAVALTCPTALAGTALTAGASACVVNVASGPNAASPHHEPSARVLQPGDAVVVDIGGTMPTGYCSDCTRVYAIGGPPAEFLRYYDVLRDAQQAACGAVRPGVTAEAVDAAARVPITEAGYGPEFVHRTGHGIGLETHEDPYIVAGNSEPLEPGMAFSVEPGIYPGPHGARIEDIVVCTGQGYERLNHVTRELVVVGGG